MSLFVVVLLPFLFALRCSFHGSAQMENLYALVAYWGKEVPWANICISAFGLELRNAKIPQLHLNKIFVALQEEHWIARQLCMKGFKRTIVLYHSQVWCPCEESCPSPTSTQEASSRIWKAPGANRYRPYKYHDGYRPVSNWCSMCCSGAVWRQDSTLSSYWHAFVSVLYHCKFSKRLGGWDL